MQAVVTVGHPARPLTPVADRGTTYLGLPWFQSHCLPVPVSTLPPNSPPAARRSRWLLGTAVVLGAMLGTVVVCELAGWPFLARPVQNALSQTLNRQVL